uniref:Ovule protein n=1 Tax=Parascaris univalens TaxID=6257 RepID=A0A915BNW4_PARUN
MCNSRVIQRRLAFPPWVCSRRHINSSKKFGNQLQKPLTNLQKIHITLWKISSISV